jgi:hypothetical protein
MTRCVLFRPIEIIMVNLALHSSQWKQANKPRTGYECRSQHTFSWLGSDLSPSRSHPLSSHLEPVLSSRKVFDGCSRGSTATTPTVKHKCTLYIEYSKSQHLSRPEWLTPCQPRVCARRSVHHLSCENHHWPYI